MGRFSRERSSNLDSIAVSTCNSGECLFSTIHAEEKRLGISIATPSRQVVKHQIMDKKDDSTANS